MFFKGIKFTMELIDFPAIWQTTCFTVVKYSPEYRVISDLISMQRGLILTFFHQKLPFKLFHCVRCIQLVFAYRTSRSIFHLFRVFDFRVSHRVAYEVFLKYLTENYCQILRNVSMRNVTQTEIRESFAIASIKWSKLCYCKFIHHVRSNKYKTLIEKSSTEIIDYEMVQLSLVSLNYSRSIQI